MVKLFTSNDDGAGHTAQAVLAYLHNWNGLESSYIDGTLTYASNPQINRWHNGREQGYVVTLPNLAETEQLNIAFFEHRNSDNICAIKWESKVISNPTIDDIPRTHQYHGDKWAIDKTIGYGRAGEMADWIYDELNTWWESRN